MVTTGTLSKSFVIRTIYVYIYNATHKHLFITSIHNIRITMIYMYGDHVIYVRIKVGSEIEQ